jgi:hypothetical protein
MEPTETEKTDDQKTVDENAAHAAQYFPLVHEVLKIVGEAGVPLHDASNPADQKTVYGEVEPTALKVLAAVIASGVSVETFTKDVEAHVKTVIANVMLVAKDKMNEATVKLVKSRFDGKMPSKDMSVKEISDLLDEAK